MATTARPAPWVYVTWVTGLIAGDKQCAFAPWLQAHFKIEKLARGFDLSAWKVEHSAMVEARVRALVADGWTVFVEDQNDFKLRGQAATLSGKCDIVAVRGDDALVEDCKSGQQRDSDFVQVLIYMIALPLFHAAVKGKRLVGAVQYKKHRREVQPEELTPALRQRILDTIKRMGDRTPPAAVPSSGECRFCDVSKADCAQRIEYAGEPVTVSEW